MTRVIAVNGSPRKKWNTAQLLEKALEGAASRGATTELVHLYDLDFKGCGSCFACKTRNGASFSRCARQDDLTPLLKKIENADVLLLGSPIYFSCVTGEMRSFLERLWFPYLAYTAPREMLFRRTMPTGFIYTMNFSEEELSKNIAWQNVQYNAMVLQTLFGPSEALCSTDTLQFDDYAKVVADRFDPAHKARRRKEVFPRDCEKAFELGARLARGAVDGE